MEEPREGTEAYRVKREVEKKMGLAVAKKLDELFSVTYHDSILSYPYCFKNERDNKYVYPTVTSVTESKIKEGERQDNLDVIEFILDSKNYKITERRWSGYDNSSYLELNLYLNEDKVFGINESIEYDEWGTTYRPSGIKAYASDEWVNDFKEINEHHNQVRKQAQIAEAEDEKKTQELKRNFGIS